MVDIREYLRKKEKNEKKDSKNFNGKSGRIV